MKRAVFSEPHTARFQLGTARFRGFLIQFIGAKTAHRKNLSRFFTANRTNLPNWLVNFVDQICNGITSFGIFSLWQLINQSIFLRHSIYHGILTGNLVLNFLIYTQNFRFLASVINWFSGFKLAATACSNKFPVLFPVLWYLSALNISCLVCREFGCRIMCAANFIRCLLMNSKSSDALRIFKTLPAL